MDGSTTLYRFWSRDRVLLYVGISGNPGRRFNQHSKDKPWWGEVVHTTHEQFDTREEALDAEYEAIQRECPVYNIVHAIPGGTPARRVDVVLRCDACDQGIAPYDGYMYVDPQEAQLAADVPPPSGLMTLSAFIDATPEDTAWRAFHTWCDPDPDPSTFHYTIAGHQIAEWPKFVGVLGHLLGKPWQEGTDLRSQMEALPYGGSSLFMEAD